MGSAWPSRLRSDSSRGRLGRSGSNWLAGSQRLIMPRKQWLHAQRVCAWDQSLAPPKDHSLTPPVGGLPPYHRCDGIETQEAPELQEFEASFADMSPELRAVYERMHECTNARARDDLPTGAVRALSDANNVASPTVTRVDSRGFSFLRRQSCPLCRSAFACRRNQPFFLHFAQHESHRIARNSCARRLNV